MMNLHKRAVHNIHDMEEDSEEDPEEDLGDDPEDTPTFIFQ